MTQSLQGNILTPGGWVRGTIAFDQHILRIDGQAGDPASNGDDFILPGFIDLHVHGGGGRDVMQAGDAAQTIARLHASPGTTSLLATTMTAPDSDIDHALRAIAAACVHRPTGAARLLGAHLEGPFINPAKLGAQPDHARVATQQALTALRAMKAAGVLVACADVAQATRLGASTDEVADALQAAARCTLLPPAERSRLEARVAKQQSGKH